MKLLDRIFGNRANEIETMQAEVSVGDAFKTWVQSDIGRYVMGRAEQYEIQVLKELAKVPPEETLEIIRLQTESRMPGKLIEWIEEVINQGEVAKFGLAELEAEDLQ